MLSYSSLKTAVIIKSSQREKMRSKTNLRIKNEMNNVERELIVKSNCTTEHFMIITISSKKRKNPINR